MINSCYVDKLPYLVMCNKCNYFPLNSQIPILDVPVIMNIFGIQWKCPYCLHTVIQPTDHNYRVYATKGGILLDKVQQKQYQTAIVIYISEQLNEEYASLPMYPEMINISQISKITMAEQSKLFSIYQNAKAAKQRLQKGRSFCWNTFMKAKDINKLEYALWFSDLIKNHKQSRIILCSESGLRTFDTSDDYNLKQFSEYIKTGNQTIFYSIKNPFLKDFLGQQEQVIFFIGNPSQIRILPQVDKAQCIILQNSENNFSKHKIDNLINKQIKIIRKKCFLNQERNVSTEKQYVQQKIFQLTSVKYSLTAFLKQNSEDWKLIFSKKNSSDKKLLNSTQNFYDSFSPNKKLYNPQLFSNSNNNDKNRFFQAIFDQFCTFIQQQQQSIQKVQEQCNILMNKFSNSAYKIKVLIKIYQSKVYKKYTFLLANYHDNISQTRQLEKDCDINNNSQNQMIDVIEYLSAACRYYPINEDLYDQGCCNEE